MLLHLPWGSIYTHALKAFTYPQGVHLPWTERKAKFRFLWNNCIKCLCFTLNHQNHAFWIIRVKNKNSLLFFLTTACSVEKCPTVLSKHLSGCPTFEPHVPSCKCCELHSPSPQHFSDGWSHSISLSIIYFHKSTCFLWRIPGSLGPSSSYANLSHSVVPLA